MALKKMRIKSRKSVVKRVKFSKGGDVKEGKMVVNRINDNHFNNRKPRSVTIKARTDTVLSKIHNKLRSIVNK